MIRFTEQTPLAEVKALKRLSAELSQIIDILIPGLDDFPSAAVIHDLGPRNAYNASISLDLLMREHGSGRRILYMDAAAKEMAASPPALLCFEQNAAAPWLLVLPAGEEDHVPAAKSSGVPVAYETVKYGVNTAVLRYGFGAAQAELQRQITAAAEILRHRGADRIALAGFANGGNAALRWAACNKDKTLAVICASAPASKAADVIGPGFPPVYIIHGALDEAAPPENAQVLADKLKAEGIRHRLWIVLDARDNFGKGYNTMADGWLGSAVSFCFDNEEGHYDSK